MLDEATVEQFKADLRGELIQPGDPDYDEARKVYNGMIDKRPLMIARCSDAADVISCVNFARENEVLLAVRGGGLGVADDGLVIDLSAMRSVRVDPDAQTVRVEGGATWGDVDHAAHAFGLAVPTGIISTTGVAGLTLGGGHGYLTRKYGLTIDNLLEADVVLADGSFVKASDEENEDLFWAIRGGGGNFGVVTSFLFKGNPVSTVYAGPMFWELDRAEEILRWYREFSPRAPEDLYGFFAYLTVPPAPPSPSTCMARRCAASSGATPGLWKVRKKRSGPSAKTWGRPPSSSSALCPSPCSTACSTPSTRRGCSSTGGATS
jgi:FAD/FMN-containing dehydrogenase